MAAETPSPTASLPLLHDYPSSNPNSPLEKRLDVHITDLEDGDDDYFDDVELRPRRPTRSWTRFLMALSRRRNASGKQRAHPDKLQLEALNLPSAKERAQRRWKKRYAGWLCVVVPILVVFFFGVVHITNVVLGYVPIFQDDRIHRFHTPAQFQPGQTSLDPESYYSDVTRDVTPIPCHSHNDYWRRIPLYDALSYGCTGVEADVWLFNNEQGENELFVGHNTNALTQNRTFRNMYVDPLLKMLDHKNEPSKYGSDSTTTTIDGVFDVDPTRTVVLLIDFKNDGHNIYPVVSEQLNALREKGYLSYFDGENTISRPVTVVATGNAPFDLITANSTYRDIFFDSPLERMYEEPVKAQKRAQGQVGTDPDSEFDTTNSYYASLSFNGAIGWIWFNRFSDAQLDKVRGQIQGAHKRGLKVRYWDTPKWPISLRNKVWEVLVEEGADYINGDDLEAMAGLNWDMRGHSGWLG